MSKPHNLCICFCDIVACGIRYHWGAHCFKVCFDGSFIMPRVQHLQPRPISWVQQVGSFILYDTVEQLQGWSLADFISVGGPVEQEPERNDWNRIRTSTCWSKSEFGALCLLGAITGPFIAFTTESFVHQSVQHSNAPLYWSFTGWNPSAIHLICHSWEQSFSLTDRIHILIDLGEHSYDDVGSSLPSHYNAFALWRLTS